MMLTDTLTRLKKNRSFQLGNLTDKGTSEQLLKLEYGLSQLQSVFDVVQMALRGELVEHSTQASLLQAHATEQQRILRSTRSDINAVLAAVQGIKYPFHYLLRSTRVFSPILPKHHRYLRSPTTTLTIIGGTNINQTSNQ